MKIYLLTKNYLSLCYLKWLIQVLISQFTQDQIIDFYHLLFILQEIMIITRYEYFLFKTIHLKLELNNSENVDLRYFQKIDE